MDIGPIKAQWTWQDGPVAETMRALVAEVERLSALSQEVADMLRAGERASQKELRALHARALERLEE